MKHTITKSGTIIIGAGLFAYVGWLFFQGYHVTVDESQAVNMIALLLCGLLALYLLVIVFIPTLMPTNRWTLLLVGVMSIFLADMYLQDAASRMIYLKDIMKLVGVFLALIGPMKLLVSQQVQAILDEKNIEIIEV